MDIQVSSAKLNVGGDQTLPKEQATDYVTQEIEKICEQFDLTPVSARVKLYTEGAENDPVQKVDIKITTKGAVINQSAHSRSIKKAIDRAIPDLSRQVRKIVNKRRDKPRDAARKGKKAANAAAQKIAEEIQSE